MIARMPERPVVLEMQHITKRFPGIVANDDVSFDLREGEVHALLGENGAGKSTLMNILYGLYHPDEGEIRIKGKSVQLGSPRAAIDAGVGMVHQHFMLIPVMTVAENIVLAEEPTYAGVMLDFGEARSRVRELSDRYGLAVDPDARIQDITVAQQQRVEILKALVLEPDLALVGRVQPVEDVHQRRLAGAVLAEQGVNLAVPQIEIDVVVGEHARELLRDPAELEDRGLVHRAIKQQSGPGGPLCPLVVAGVTRPSAAA